MIEAQHLVKWYGPNLAVNDLSFAIPKGQIVGFLGPNGAGKSTTLRMLTGFLPPTTGTATIDGHDVIRQSAAARGKIGYMPEATPLYPEMRVEEYLHYRGKLHGVSRADRRKRIDKLVDRCGLTPVRRRAIGKLSKGNKQRVGLAQSLLHDPPVLILDEPTAGLDPNQIGHVRSLIDELRGDHTVLLSTHILPEVEKTADRVIIIARGQIVADGTVEELRDRIAAGSGIRMEVKADEGPLREALDKLENVGEVEVRSLHKGWTRALVKPRGQNNLREPLGEMAKAKQWTLRELRPEHASLESFFVQITAEQDQAKSNGQNEEATMTKPQ